jgi:hypothetical protein
MAMRLMNIVSGFAMPGSGYQAPCKDKTPSIDLSIVQDSLRLTLLIIYSWIWTF